MAKFLSKRLAELEAEVAAQQEIMEAMAQEIAEIKEVQRIFARTVAQATGATSLPFMIDLLGKKQ